MHIHGQTWRQRLLMVGSLIIVCILAISYPPGAFSQVPSIAPSNNNSKPTIRVLGLPIIIDARKKDSCPVVRVRMGGNLNDALAVYLSPTKEISGAVSYFDKMGGITPGTYGLSTNGPTTWCTRVGYPFESMKTITKRMHVIVESYDNVAIASTSFNVVFKPEFGSSRQVAWIKAPKTVREGVVAAINREQTQLGIAARGSKCFSIQSLVGNETWAKAEFSLSADPIACNLNDGFGIKLLNKTSRTWTPVVSTSGIGGRCIYYGDQRVSIKTFVNGIRFCT